ncbi:HEAT repeat domain-containing protein [Leptothoe kymatousa]|uniref:HEAT repeat domain-containing protein n=1 Tax=Leptothoe kymatousa TAU-MAC 1615 TaxID=2364775 RepID=A0ABS5Y1G4_9CYAN|nr:HEAT repeat domain-containing protein [Leptothoe kymatousa]MBT9311659.1 HEAT repeat domain-containing protein [Leptothoe kymatousa TAU-MAC 1615]
MPPARGFKGTEYSQPTSPSGDYWQSFKTGDFKEKWNSSKLIVKEGKGAIAPLLQLLHDPTADAETHWFTIRALGSFPDPQVIQAIAAQIGPACQVQQRTAEQATELSNFAIETLAAMGPMAVDVLTQLLKTSEQRLLAAKALNQIRSNSIIPAMVSITKDEDATVRYYAIDALGSFHNPIVTPVLIDALKDPAASVRKAAVMALGRRHDLYTDCQLSQRLKPLLWDLDVTVCRQAALALGRLGAGDMVDTLHQLLLSANTPLVLRLDILRALAWCCDKASADAAQSHALNQAPQRAYDALTQSLQAFANPKAPLDTLTTEELNQLLVAIIHILGDSPINQETSSHSLIAYLASPPHTLAVVQAIIMALANLAQPDAFEALLPLLTHTADIIPIHTIAALKRLDPNLSAERVHQYLDNFPDHKANVLQFW